MTLLNFTMDPFLKEKYTEYITQVKKEGKGRGSTSSDTQETINRLSKPKDSATLSHEEEEKFA